MSGAAAATRGGGPPVVILAVGADVVPLPGARFWRPAFFGGAAAGAAPFGVLEAPFAPCGGGGAGCSIRSSDVLVLLPLGSYVSRNCFARVSAAIADLALVSGTRENPCHLV
jgi:hypothetical protein